MGAFAPFASGEAELAHTKDKKGRIVLTIPSFNQSMQYTRLARHMQHYEDCSMTKA